jgi:hypothetical protein
MFTSGRAEREISEGYQRKARELGDRGFDRLARTLRELAEEYDQDAQRQAAQDPFDE